MNINTIKNAVFGLGKLGLRVCLVTGKLLISSFIGVIGMASHEETSNNLKSENNEILGNIFKGSMFVGTYKALNWLENTIGDKIVGKSSNLEQSVNSETKEKSTFGKSVLKFCLVATKLAISGAAGSLFAQIYRKKRLLIITK